ncbi:DNA-binding transcriptional regulator, AcrR family [Brevibacterium siliguriense]|uniref:DNA-binding transcriptional regulator, AcrR family n=1 Tax=Brevibacterium siliguriense TaxID=1136497 RepID=A0A1H1V9J0_9MICO|nr:TetR/AcrR family transcriptional regulator [Brevibacterium siliguriense]SDS81418.1 DNA-binding transcriptional regulator, AcrR family [Brevibacterium siliguriense]
MSSPQQRLPRDQRRDQLVGVARSVFATRGYRTTSMDMIAEAAGVSKPVLYQHFDSKQDLYLALIDSSAAHLDSRLAEALGSTTDPHEQVHATYRAYFDFVVSHREEFVIIFNSDVYEPKAEQRLRALRESSATRVVSALQNFARLTDDEAQLLCRALIGTAEVVVKQIDSQRGIDADTAVELLTQMSWGGLRSFADR